MDKRNLTAPCGIACFECVAFKAKSNAAIKKRISEGTGLPYEKSDCEGCRHRGGKAYLFEKNDIIASGKCFLFGNEQGQCRIYLCAEKKGLHNCSECGDFPCELLAPLADKAGRVPHNLKLYNLCLIRKLGLEKWATEKAASALSEYFTKRFDS